MTTTMLERSNSERTRDSEREFWGGLTDWATDVLGSAAAGALVQKAHEADDPFIVTQGINYILDIQIAELLETTAV